MFFSSHSQVARRPGKRLAAIRGRIVGMVLGTALLWLPPGHDPQAVVGRCRAAEPGATLPSLLDEMVDRDALARLPRPAYTCRQASSYDRRSVSPEDPQGWFANGDWSQFIRSEKTDGRTEWVMLDSDGPGCVVRMWSGGPKPRGKIRFYLDGAAKPVIEMPTDELIGGRGLVGPPLSEVTARGLNLYLPIPYAKHCKITYDGPNSWQTKNNADRIWYNFNYRTYEKGTRVESYSPAIFAAAAEKIAIVQKKLAAPVKDKRDSLEQIIGFGNVRLGLKASLKPGQSLSLPLHEGSHALCELTVHLQADQPEIALRTTVLSIEFDGRQTVCCPVGDFFGSGVGVNPYRDWWRSVDAQGWMTCYWVMPYEKSCTVRLTNHGKHLVAATLAAENSRWHWDDRSMTFHATWRRERLAKKSLPRDWNYVTIEGQGVYVGDTLSVVNPDAAWWGEGDEKIYVDGEKFPSHHGTGSEDYYGYAWGDPHVFSSPLHAQPRAGARNQGHTTNTRTRSLDAIPFQHSLNFDMEVESKAHGDMTYAAATYWYARGKATCNRPPDPAQLGTE